MKHFTKISLIICGVLAGVGILFCIVAAASGFSRFKLRAMVEDGELSFGPLELAGFGDWDWGWDWDWDSDDDWYNDDNWGEDMYKDWLIDSDDLESKWTTDGHSYDAAKIRKLDVEYGFGTVILAESESGKLEVESNYRSIWGNYQRDIRCDLDGSTLKLRDKTDKKIFRMKHGIKDATLVIRLPKDTVLDKIDLEFGAADVKVETPLRAGEVELAMGAGSIQGENAEYLLDASKLTLEVGAGEMDLSGIRTKKLDAECGVGTLALKNVTMEECSLECGIGSLELSVNGRQEDFDYKIDCGIGKVALGSASYSGLGRSKTIDNDAGGRMDIDCGIGEVVVSFQK